MSDENLEFGYYLVGFLDLLGQREQLRGMDFLPPDKEGEEYKKFLDIVRNTVGAVQSLQNDASQFFDSFVKGGKKGSLGDALGLRAFKRTNIKFQHFSDGLVVYIPLKSTNDNYPVTSVYASIASFGELCLLGLAKNSPIRVGVSVGVGAELNENEIYGKSVADAYELESQIAKYPRAVVSERVWDYLDYLESGECGDSDLACKFEKQLSGSCRKMLTRDEDGHLIVDYLGSYMREDVMEGVGEELVGRARDYISGQLEKHKNEKSTELAFRYALLKNYFQNKNSW